MMPSYLCPHRRGAAAGAKRGLCTVPIVSVAATGQNRCLEKTFFLFSSQTQEPEIYDFDEFDDFGEQLFEGKPSKIRFAVSFQKARKNGAAGSLELQE